MLQVVGVSGSIVLKIPTVDTVSVCSLLELETDIGNECGDIVEIGANQVVVGDGTRLAVGAPL